MKLIRTKLSADTPFSFDCKQCLRCCYGKRIQINPYEAARLSRNLDISTTEFTEKYTASNGTVLGWTDRGSCVFLDSHGCSVHPDRPLVCRLYPLGRHVSAGGEETFSELDREQGCEGFYGASGQIVRYLGEQGAKPFVEAADRYLELLWKLTAVAKQTAVDPGQRKSIIKTVRRFKGGEKLKTSSWMDMDAAVGRFCEETGVALPEELEDKMALHIQAVETWLGETTKGDKDEKSKAAKNRETGRKKLKRT